MDQLTVTAVVSGVHEVTRFVGARLDGLGCSERVRVQVNVAIDEIFSNIARYAYNPETGPATVRVEVEENPLSVIITFIDRGVPFDPLAADIPDTTVLPKEKRPDGGLGLFLVKQIMDKVSYQYVGNQNILTLEKNIK